MHDYLSLKVFGLCRFLQLPASTLKAHLQLIHCLLQRLLNNLHRTT